MDFIQQSLEALAPGTFLLAGIGRGDGDDMGQIEVGDGSGKMMTASRGLVTPVNPVLAWEDQTAQCAADGL